MKLHWFDYVFLGMTSGFFIGYLAATMVALEAHVKVWQLPRKKVYLQFWNGLRGKKTELND